ncbi:hypothetical protein KIPB_014457, partial [Kipferlia bialata]|eukprot:g14457.t1
MCLTPSNSNRCYGQCPQSGSACKVVGPSNTTCACTGCGYTDSNMDHCSGSGCVGSQSCFQ